MPALNFLSWPSLVREPSGNTISEAPERAIRCIRLKIPAPGFFRFDQHVAASRQVPADERHVTERALAMILNCRGSPVKTIGVS